MYLSIYIHNVYTCMCMCVCGVYIYMHLNAQIGRQRIIHNYIQISLIYLLGAA